MVYVSYIIQLTHILLHMWHITVVGILKKTNLSFYGLFNPINYKIKILDKYNYYVLRINRIVYYMLFMLIQPVAYNII